MEKLIEILEDIQPDADYETCTTLIDDGILDSFAILSIVGELEDEFDVSVEDPESIVTVKDAVDFVESHKEA